MYERFDMKLCRVPLLDPTAVGYPDQGSCLVAAERVRRNKKVRAEMSRATITTSTTCIAKSDYDAFERLLGDIEAAYSTEDLSALRVNVAPEMLSYFSEQLAGNRQLPPG